VAAGRKNIEEGSVNFEYSPKVQELQQKLAAFMAEHVYPNEHKWHAHVKSEKRWEVVPVIEQLKPKARAAGLWNLWRPKTHGGTLANLEYAPLCEIMGRRYWCAEVNCSAPTPATWRRSRYSTRQIRWCEPIRRKIRSAFLMTEPNGEPDATNIQMPSSATADTSSTAASGGPRGRATRAARCTS
jgi:acyl-CoA dehydrogenase